MLATLVAPILTIAVSGLYTSQLVPRFASVAVIQTDWFDVGNAATAQTFARDVPGKGIGSFFFITLIWS